MAISEHIISYYASACWSVLVRIDKPGNHRVIITALQVVEARLGIVVIPTVPQGLSSARLPLEEMSLPRCRTRRWPAHCRWHLRCGWCRPAEQKMNFHQKEKPRHLPGFSSFFSTLLPFLFRRHTAFLGYPPFIGHTPIAAPKHQP